MIVVVGCGLSGSVLAERFASFGHKVLILEKRDHIGGNCYDHVDRETGVLMNKYGAHLFHTNDKEVYDYVTSFHDWIRWEHKVVAEIDGMVVPVPPNITTVNRVCKENLQTEQEAREWFDGVRIAPKGDPSNGEEMAKSRVGEVLYEKIFKHYTKKQWGVYPSELAPEVLARIPSRESFDERYFTDKYQILPDGGYTKFFEKLLASDKISVRLNTDYLDVRDELPEHSRVFFTGPIDAFFSTSGLPPLEYRSLRFHIDRYLNTPFHQTNSVVNFPGPETPYTRSIEYKHFLHQSSPHTVVVRETSAVDGEPYYPVLNDRNKELYTQYQKLAAGHANVHFVGRLASFKYFNMDQAIRNALDVFTSCGVSPCLPDGFITNAS